MKKVFMTWVISLFCMLYAVALFGPEGDNFLEVIMALRIFTFSILAVLVSVLMLISYVIYSFVLWIMSLIRKSEKYGVLKLDKSAWIMTTLMSSVLSVYAMFYWIQIATP